MKRKIICAALMICMLLSSACGVRIENKDASLNAMIVSDLHFTLSDNGTDLIVPLVSHSEELMHAIVNEVTAEKPDVLIMTGDNTNSGDPKDEKALSEYLKEIRDARIAVVVTTGNHDWNLSDPKTYESLLFPSFTVTEKDPDSLSYVTEINGVSLLAMDDNSASVTAGGVFSKQTMKWLKKELKKAYQKGNQIVFLSHHSVLSDEGNMSSDYWIHNKDLRRLLKKYGVSLCLSGHQHSQSILQDGSLHEIISAMPADGSHLIGTLSIRNQDYVYHAEPINFVKYGSAGLYEIVQAADEKEQRQKMSVFETILKNKNLSEEDQKGCLDLLTRFFRWYGDGTIADHVSEFRNDPYCSTLLEALKDENYGPWMERIVDNPPLDALHLSFTAERK